jgi:hypothetical protein
VKRIIFIALASLISQVAFAAPKECSLRLKTATSTRSFPIAVVNEAPNETTYKIVQGGVTVEIIVMESRLGTSTIINIVDTSSRVEVTGISEALTLSTPALQADVTCADLWS